jgi:murein DD-endopeptidase MepM/ murein hydrolase activator NlpD
MMRLVPLAAIIMLMLLAACARNGPPAPLTFPGGQGGQSGSGQESARTTPAAKPARPKSTSAPAATSGHNPLPADSEVPPPPPPAPPSAPNAPNASPATAAHPQPPAQIVVSKDPPFQLVAGTTLNLPQEHFYTVQQGDTLYGISRNYGVEVSTLASLNRLSEPYTLQSGQTLELPPSVEPPAPAPDTKPEVPGSSPPPNKPAETAQTAPPPASDKPIPPRVGKGFDWPIQGRIIERYGTGPNGTHNDGINIAAHAGEPVRAADAGTIAYAGNELRGYGNLILIKHAGGYMTAYAHNSQLLVRRGDVVKRGQEIAKAGSTGTVDTPQVHFEIRKGTRTVDPVGLLPSLRASAN